MPPKPSRVRVIETGRVYESARACARSLGGDYSAIYRCLKDIRQTHLGYTYEYASDEDFYNDEG